MAMGNNKHEQGELFVTHDQLRQGGHPFYVALDKLLKTHGFDSYVEDLCRPFYADKLGRPSTPPGLYFRCLLIGYFEGIDSERGIAWRVADSLSLRDFLGLPLSKNPPDHSTLSRTRRLLDVETHQKVFDWVLARLAESGLVKGKTVGVDATTLEANAALRSIVRREDGETYEEFLHRLAEASGLETPSRADLAKLDKKRPKKGSNDEWVNPHDPDAQIMKMKDGRTHLAHKHEHAVDMETGAVLGIIVTGGARHDTKTGLETLEAAQASMDRVLETVDDKVRAKMAERIEEGIFDKGYHSNDFVMQLENCEVRGYVSEPDRGRRNWKNKEEAKQAVYRNRRRIRGNRGKRLLRQRGEKLERPFAHALETGGMRRTHLRHHDNILKRMLIHIAGLNLGLLMRKKFGVGSPRALQGRSALAAALLRLLVTALRARMSRLNPHIASTRTLCRNLRGPVLRLRPRLAHASHRPFTTGC